jgi:hypothetical protein
VGTVELQQPHLNVYNSAALKCSAHTLPEGSLLSERYTVSRHTCTYNCMHVHNSSAALPAAVFTISQSVTSSTCRLSPYRRSPSATQKVETFIDTLKYPEVWLSLRGYSGNSGRPAPSSGDLLYRTSATWLRNEKSEGRNFVTLSGKIRQCVSSHERQRYAKNAYVGHHENPRNG